MCSNILPSSAATMRLLCCPETSLRVSRDQTGRQNNVSTWSFEQQRQGVGAKVVPQVLLIPPECLFHVGPWTQEGKAAPRSDYIPSIFSLMVEKQQPGPDWCSWGPAAPRLIHSPEHASAWHLPKGTGTPPRDLVPPLLFWSRAKEWPRAACQRGPLSVGPGHQTRGPTLAPVLFWGLWKD